MKKSGQIPSFGQGLELANIVNKAIANVIKENKISSDQVQAVIGKPGQIFDYFKKLFSSSSEKISSILSLLSISETLVLESLDGKATIANTKNTFKSYLDLDFKNWHLDNKGRATKETTIQIYEMGHDDANFSQTFNSLSNDLDSLCLTQNQIIRFCEKYPSHLRQDGYATFFLFKENNEYFVARVRVYSGGLFVGVGRFADDGVWSLTFVIVWWPRN